MPKQAPVEIAALMGDRQNPFWTGMEEDYHKLGPERGLVVKCFYARPEQDPAAQAAELARLGGLGYPAIIINPLNASCLAEQVVALAQKGIKLLDVGSKTDRDLLGAAGGYYVPVKTVDFEEQGRLGAGYLAGRLGPGKKVALLGGRPTARQSIGRLAGAEAEFSARGLGVAARAFAGFEREEGRRRAGELLSQHRDLAGIFCANDLMALGAAQAARQAGRPDLLVAGVDLIPEAARAIAGGSLAASVAFSRHEVAVQVLAAVQSALDGRPWPDRYCVTSRLATAENIAEFGD